MTAQHSPLSPNAVKLPIPVTPSLPDVVALKVADPSSSPAGQPAFPDGHIASPTLDTDHLWVWMEGYFLRDTVGFILFSLPAATVLGVTLYAFIRLPRDERPPTTWTAMWLEGGLPRFSAAISFLAGWIATICLVWPLNVSVCVLGAVYYSVAHGLLIYGVGVPLAFLYSTYSNRTRTVSSLLSFGLPTHIAHLIDFFTPVAFPHYLIRSFGPAHIAYFLPILIAFYTNALLLVFGTSFPHLIYRLVVVIRSDGREQGCPSCAGGEAVSRASVEEIEKLRREIEALKAMLTKAK